MAPLRQGRAGRTAPGTNGDQSVEDINLHMTSAYEHDGRITTPPGSQHYRVAHLWPRYNNKINVNDLLSPLFTLEMTSYHFSVFF